MQIDKLREVAVVIRGDGRWFHLKGIIRREFYKWSLPLKLNEDLYIKVVVD